MKVKVKVKVKVKAAVKAKKVKAKAEAVVMVRWATGAVLRLLLLVARRGRVWMRRGSGWHSRSKTKTVNLRGSVPRAGMLGKARVRASSARG